MIALEDVEFRWRRDMAPTIDIPALSIEPGSRAFLRGPSGSGKTTLLNLLGGVMAPQRGTIRIGETDIAALSGAARDRFRADRIGFIFQQFNLVPYLPLIQNVTLPLRFSARRRDAIQGTPEAAARRLLSHMKLDPDTLAKRPVAELSTGQQQRVAAARALIGAPEVIIADEPTSAIDADARSAFLDLLFAEVQASGATLLFVSHDPGLDQYFDRTIELAAINRAATGPDGAAMAPDGQAA